VLVTRAEIVPVQFIITVVVPKDLILLTQVLYLEEEQDHSTAAIGTVEVIIVVMVVVVVVVLIINHGVRQLVVLVDIWAVVDPLPITAEHRSVPVMVAMQVWVITPQLGDKVVVVV